jgi:hypothetical protein
MRGVQFITAVGMRSELGDLSRFEHGRIEPPVDKGFMQDCLKALRLREPVSNRAKALVEGQLLHPRQLMAWLGASGLEQAVVLKVTESARG